MDFEKFEERAGVIFKNKSLLKQAFTHRSYINENRGLALEHNERLEFLGDAVLELAITGYLYQGYDVAKKFILTHIAPLVEEVLAGGDWIDAKSRFQEKAQEYMGVTPVYKTVRESGPDHDKYFTVTVSVGDEICGEGRGKSKQDAEQEAARQALEAKDWK